MESARQRFSIPGEVENWRELVGNIYRLPRFKRPFRFGPFGIEAYEAAAGVLIPWPDGLLDMKPAWDELPHVGHPLTIELLQRAANQLTDISGIRGVIRTNGFYRPPGTTWGTGYYGDPDGAIDSTDSWGHWRLAIDIAAGTTATSFGVPRDDVGRVLGNVGLSRPLLAAGEYWHYRPNAKQRKNWIAKIK